MPAKSVETTKNIVIYGLSGTGKTTLACTFPKPVLLIDIKEHTVDTIGDEPGIFVLRAETWEDLVQVYWMLHSGDHDFKTVIVDTVSQAQDLAIAYHVETKGGETQSGRAGEWGSMTKQDWGKVSGLLKSWILDMRDLKINTIFIAQHRVFTVDEGEIDEEEGTIAPEVGPRVMPSVAAVMNAAVGIIGNTFIRERVRKRKIGKRVKETRIMEYCLRVGPYAYYTTKIRKPKRIKPPQFIVDPSYEKIIAAEKGKGE